MRAAARGSHEKRLDDIGERGGGRTIEAGQKIVYRDNFQESLLNFVRWFKAALTSDNGYRKRFCGNSIASVFETPLLLGFSGQYPRFSRLLKFLSVEAYLIRGWKQLRFGIKLVGDDG